ncbi:MAG: HAMP domain-containing histidine kinase [Anaerolineaceae bacterium]|nr:MAG: HAMP domain-containing histidine kinase [Anaerolineaceae bacterium]
MLDRTTLSSSIIAERLGRSEIFGDLCEADLLAIAEFCCEETYDEGNPVLVENEAADKLYIVERGKLALEKKIQIGRHSTRRNAIVGYVGPREIAGISTLASPHIYTTSAVCIEPTRIIIVDGEVLRDYLETHPAAGLKVMKTLAVLVSSRYRDATNTLTYFLSIVSHELRSPLAAIENYLQIMLDGLAGDLTTKQERMMRRCVLRLIDMRALLGNVVDLARMRPQQIQADFEWFDPGEVGTESIEDVRLAAAEKGIRILVKPPPKFEPIVGARRRIRQVFTNLLNNAIKYSPTESTVYFRARYDAENLIFEVEDEGSGIPPEELPHIFSDFYRARNVVDTEGSGLGLSIAKKIVEAHDGQILIKNLETEGRSGTCFTVRIPRDLKTPEMRRRELLAEEL